MDHQHYLLRLPCLYGVEGLHHTMSLVLLWELIHLGHCKRIPVAIRWKFKFKCHDNIDNPIVIKSLTTDCISGTMACSIIAVIDVTIKQFDVPRAHSNIHTFISEKSSHTRYLMNIIIKDLCVWYIWNITWIIQNTIDEYTSHDKIFLVQINKQNI